MLVSRFTSKVEACGFVNPDGEKNNDSVKLYG